jgi:dCMP deaminase
MKQKFLSAYMQTAKIFADLSTARRLHVGAIVVKDDRIISIGYNGMPSGWSNDCEILETTYDERDTHSSNDWQFDEKTKKYHRLKSKPEVLHAERNALDKLARGHESGLGAAMFITHAPCLECAKSIYGAGIDQVYYGEEYRSTDGVKFLEKCKIKISKYQP